jgi:hypothetical protein
VEQKGITQIIHELSTLLNTHDLTSGLNGHEMDAPEKIREMSKGLVRELEGDIVYNDADGKGDEEVGFIMAG